MQMAESRCSCTPAQERMRRSNPLAFTLRFTAVVCRAAHFPTCALQQTPFLGSKVPFPLESQVISAISSKFPQKGWDSPEFFWYRGRTQRRVAKTHRLPEGAGYFPQKSHQ